MILQGSVLVMSPDMSDLSDKKRDIEIIVENLHSFDGDQAHMDSVYDQLIGLMFSGLHKVKCHPVSASRQKH